MLKLNFKINDIKLTLNLIKNIKVTILEACLNSGIYIPHFCYNKFLLIAGNCRICVIEVEKFIKPIISCLNICIENLSIYTNSFSLKKFRENVLEFLLINHPLDCPICDQAGECDLQEQTLKYGLDKSRFFFVKKVNSDIYLNNYIKLILNRCILCVRCVRFLKETNINIIYKDILGTIGRGSLSKIHLYKNTKLEILGSANIIDICPVGALTLKVNQFSYRPWELTSIIGFDVFDSFGSPLKLDFKNNKIIRILPYLDSIFSIDFISDITRFNLKFYNNIYLQLTNKKSINENYFLSLSKESIILNISKNPLISYDHLKSIFYKLISKHKYITTNINYSTTNNKYILSNSMLAILKQTKKVYINSTLKIKMYRFFIYLNEINTKYNNVFYYINEDLKYLQTVITKKNEIKFINKFDNSFNNIYMLKYLNYFKTLLNFENISKYNFKKQNYNNNKINYIDFPKYTFNNENISNLFVLKNINLDSNDLYNNFGYNINNQNKLVNSIIKLKFYY